MNVTNNQHLTIPIFSGLSLTVAPGHEKTLELALAHMPMLVERLNSYHCSPLLGEFLDTVLARFLGANNYTQKTVYMYQARMAKLKLVLTAANPLRRVAELGATDVKLLKDELPLLLKQNSKSGSKGENLQAYFILFNRMIDEAVGDRLVSDPIKIQGCKSKKGDITKAFLDSNLVSLFNAWPYRQYAANIDRGTVLNDANSSSFWLMPLGLFTGARLNELCQLRVHDVIEDVHGVNLISINANGFGKSLKNPQSAREIPICSKLITMGFLDFVAERKQAGGENALLFSELLFDKLHLYSRAPSRFFCGPVTGTGFIGKHCPIATDGGFNFKSFRRTFAVRLQLSRVPIETIGHLLGHKSSTQEVTNEHYLETPPSVALLEQLERGLSYNLPLGQIQWQHFKHLMTSQADRKPRGRKSKKARS